MKILIPITHDSDNTDVDASLEAEVEDGEVALRIDDQRRTIRIDALDLRRLVAVLDTRPS